MNPELSVAGDGSGPPAEDGSCTTVYLSVPLLSGMTPEDVRLALARAARRTLAGGRYVRHVHSMYLPARARLLCVFVAEGEDAVYAAVRSAGLPFVPIEAPPLPPPAVPPAG